MKTKLGLFVSMIAAVAVTGAFGAASIRTGAPTNTVKTQAITMPTNTGVARAGSLKVSPNIVNSDQPVADSTNARLALSKSMLSKLKETSTKTDNNARDNSGTAVKPNPTTIQSSDIAELDKRVTEVEKKMDKMEDVTGDLPIVIDDELSTTSTNPVQNRVVTNALDGKQNKSTASTSIAGPNGTWIPVGDGDYVNKQFADGGPAAMRFDIRPDRVIRTVNGITSDATGLVQGRAVYEALQALSTDSNIKIAEVTYTEPQFISGGIVGSIRGYTTLIVVVPDCTAPGTACRQRVRINDECKLTRIYDGLARYECIREDMRPDEPGARYVIIDSVPSDYTTYLYGTDGTEENLASDGLLYQMNEVRNTLYGENGSVTEPALDSVAYDIHDLLLRVHYAEQTIQDLATRVSALENPASK
ncbi:MAG: hypothetical protein J5742_01310 [Alphaproteobacteria bacterium]|nr:hypothetical protein [Alphaproteobacteria bacterium]